MSATIGLYNDPDNSLRAPVGPVEKFRAHIACGDQWLTIASNDAATAQAVVRVAASVPTTQRLSDGTVVSLPSPIFIWTVSSGLEICSPEDLIAASPTPNAKDATAALNAVRGVIARLNEAMEAVCKKLGADVLYIAPPKADNTQLPGLSPMWKNASLALRAISAIAPDVLSRLIVVFYGLNELLDGPSTSLESVRLRDVISDLVRCSALSNDGTKRVICCVMPEASVLNPAIAHYFTAVALPLPSLDELLDTQIPFMLSCLEGTMPASVNDVSDDIKTALASAAVGLSRSDAINLLFMSVYKSGHAINETTIQIMNDLRCKKIAETGSLHFLTGDQLTKPSDMSGIDRLVADIKTIAQAFTPKGPLLNLRKETGIVLTGISGTGKSAFTKAAGSVFAEVTKQVWPVVTLDVGSLFGSRVGETEENWRRVMSQIKALGRSVIIFDECEKALAGATTTESDGGLTQRLFSNMLTWLNDLRAEGYDCFVIATMNEQTNLPMEFFQRFAGTYFADLPDPATCIEIAKIKYRMQLAPLGIGIDALNWTPAQWTEIGAAFHDFSGREIEKVVFRSRNLAASLDQEYALPTYQQVLDIIAEERPSISATSSREALDRIRDWCKTRAKPIGVSTAAPLELPIAAKSRRNNRNFDGPSAN